MTTHQHHHRTRTWRRLTLAVAVGAVLLAALLLFTPAADAHRVTGAHCRAVASVYPAASRDRMRATCTRLVVRHATMHRCASADLHPFVAITCVFPPHLQAGARAIAQCESTAHVSNAYARAHGKGRWARNGQYRGIWQIGDGERAQHGDYSVGADARVQARTALSLYRSRGWQPWTFSGASGTGCHGYS